MLDFKKIEKDVLIDIMNIRNDFYAETDNISDEVIKARNSALFDFTEHNHKCYDFVISEVKKRINKMLEQIILFECKQKDILAITDVSVGTPDNLQQINLKKLFE